MRVFILLFIWLQAGYSTNGYLLDREAENLVDAYSNKIEALVMPIQFGKLGHSHKSYWYWVHTESLKKLVFDVYGCWKQPTLSFYSNSLIWCRKQCIALAGLDLTM